MSTKATRTRVAFATAAACVAALGVAQSTQAATVEVSGDRVVVTDRDAQRNRLTVTYADAAPDAQVIVRDTAARPSAGSGCRYDAARRAAVCDHQPRVRVLAGGGADTVAVDPGFKGDVLGEGGDDLVVTGDPKWPEGMDERAEEIATMADAAEGIRWTPNPNAGPADPRLLAAAWRLAVETRDAHPAPGTPATRAGNPFLTLDGGDGDDVLLGGGGPDSMRSGSGVNFVASGGGDDSLVTSASAPGASVFVPGTGRDGLHGSPDGNAAFDYYEQTGPVSGSLERRAIDDGDGQPDTMSGFVRGFLGGRGRNVVDGASYGTLFYGSRGRDRFVGDPTIGSDLMIAGPIDEGPSLPRIGGDELVGGADADAFVTDVTDDVVTGGDERGNDSSLDTVAYVGRAHAVTVDLAKREGGAVGESDRLPGIDAVTGGDGDDVLRDSGDLVFAQNVLDGGPGDDHLSGGRDYGLGDAFFGGDGDDTIDATVEPLEAQADTVSCGAGQDETRVDANDAVDADCERVTPR